MLLTLLFLSPVTCSLSPVPQVFRRFSAILELCTSMFHFLPRLASLAMVLFLIQPFCPALILSPDSPAAAVPTGYSDCHDSMPAAPVAPAPAKKCCVASHSQIALPALRYTPPQLCAIQLHVFQLSFRVVSDSAFDPLSSNPVFDPQRSPLILRI